MEQDFKEYLKLGSQYFRTWKKIKNNKQKHDKNSKKK